MGYGEMHTSAISNGNVISIALSSDAREKAAACEPWAVR